MIFRDPGKVYDTYYSNLNYGDLSLQYYLLDKRLDENFFRYSFSVCINNEYLKF